LLFSKFSGALQLFQSLKLTNNFPFHNFGVKFFLIGIVGGRVQLGPLGTAATNGLLYQPRMIMLMEKMVE
jgi:hypothetical protein